ncbi:CPBP family intramembrane glutamic endopeptidase [Bacillus sp. Marseille-P3661]|uniref:CPBP family intramembrane glutamic endopeptidase n=1 Tax=Bacillus sp. Marseille-P3661 TaxID=1936234 RepID=UPI002155BD67|nr:type II CAAX endopeptidase family protein [Bacillus sp. Marseille-P3661]
MYIFKNKYGLVRAGWLILAAMFFYISGQIIFSLPGFYLFESIRSSEKQTEILTEISNFPWIQLMINGGGVLGSLLMTLLAWKLLNRKSILDLGLLINVSHIKDLAAGLILGSCSMTAIFVILLVTNAIQLENSLLAPQFSIYSLSFLILFILVGFSEEIFFRGYIMCTMVGRYHSTWLSYVVSAIVFSIAHGSNPNISLLGLINIGLVGLLFSYMYWTTKNLWMPIGYHITWNYFQGNVFGFPVSGTDPHGLYNITVNDTANTFTGGEFGPEGGILATVIIFIGIIITNVYCRRRKKAR